MAVAVLVLVSTVSWWYWPRGDERFVGKWSAGLGSRDPGFHAFNVQYFRHGSVSFEGSPGRYPDFRTWRVRGDRLVYGFQFPPGLYFATRWLIPQVRRLTGDRTWAHSHEVKIEKVEPDEIWLLDMTGANTRYVLIRIPE